MRDEKVVAAQFRERFTRFLADNNLTIYAASQRLGYGRSTKLNKMLTNEGAPSLQTLFEIATAFSLSLDWLVMGKGPQSVPAKAPEVTERPLSSLRGVSSGRVLAVTVDQTGHENIVHIPARALAGYSRSYDVPTYLSELMAYSLPLFSEGIYRSFEVDDDSMRPAFGTGDVVIGQFVERWDLLVPERYYVVVLDNRVLVKRIGKQIGSRKETVALESLDPGQAAYEVPASEILELWQVRAVLSKNIPTGAPEGPADVLELLQAISAEQRELRRIVEERGD